MAKEKLAKTVWVKNNENTPIKVDVRMLVGKDEETGGDVFNTVEVIFRRERTDQTTGVLISNGYTAVQSDVLEAMLKQNKVVKALFDKGTLVAYEEEPEDASSPTQKIAVLRLENERLSGELATAAEKVNTLTNENENLKAEIAKLKKGGEKAKDEAKPGTGEFATNGTGTAAGEQ